MMRWLLFLLLSSSALACGPPAGAPNTGNAHYCSATWLMTGVCDGTDQVYNWSVGGQPQSGTYPSMIYPWENVWVTVRGVEITQISGGPSVWWMAGNNIVGDAMMWIGPGGKHGRHDYPAGTGSQIMPSSQQTSLSYLDLHGACTGGGAVSLFYTIYYTVP